MHFTVREPEGAETPVVVEVPHAGLAIPAPYLATLRAPMYSVGRDADLFVDGLYEDAPLEGATLIVSHVSRYVVDLNRGEGDVDVDTVEGVATAVRATRGLVWRLTGDGEQVHTRRLTQAELRLRVEDVYRPYHAAVQAALERKVARFGRAVLLAAHSMPSATRTTSLAGSVSDELRADVVPGSRGRTTADGRYIDLVDAHARAAGYSVRHDEPYRGGFSTVHYGRPREHVHAVQVELARRLYMDEQRLAPSPDFDAMRRWCRALVAKLGQTALP
jgi:N-formylglutamate deformylase